MRFTWNEELCSWEAIVSPGVPHEHGAGPVGPAGVSLLRVRDASVSLCTMTGRATSAWIPGGPDEKESALYELTFGHSLSRGHSRGTNGAEFEDEVLPVQERMAMIRWANAHDAIRHIDFRAVIPEMFARLEYAAALAEIRSSGAAGAVLVSADHSEMALGAADRAVARVQEEAGGINGVAQWIGDLNVRNQASTAVRPIAASLRQGSYGAGDAGFRASEFVFGLQKALSSSHRGGATGTLEDVDFDVDALIYQILGSANTTKYAVPWASFGAAETASRAAWVALQQSRAGVQGTATAFSALVFGHAAMAWLVLRSDFRARWAWSLADVEEPRILRALAELDDVENRLMRPLGTADLPRADKYLPVAPWMLFANRQALLPRHRDDSESSEDFLLPADWT